MQEKFDINIEVEIDNYSDSLPNHSYDSYKSTTLLNYHVDMFFKNRGIDSIHFYVPNQVIYLDVEILNEGEDNVSERSEKVMVKVNLQDIEVSDLPLMNPRLGIMPIKLILKIKNFVKIDDIHYEADASGKLDFIP